MSRPRGKPAAGVAFAIVIALTSLSVLASIRPAPPVIASAQTSQLTPDAIARQVQDRDTGRDSRSEMRMKLYDRHGRVRERALTILSLRGRGASGAGPDAPAGDRLLIRFTYPNDIRGTGFLVWEPPDSKTEDERFLYLPSLGRVRRIAGAEAQESFVGSDFTYEDIGGRELEDYTYAFAGSEQQPRGRRHLAARRLRRGRLESRRKDASAEFPRVISLVLKDSFLVVGADVYNRRNEKQKVYTVRSIKRQVILDRVGL